MLNLILSGKSGRNINYNSGTIINLKAIFKSSEDSLTANIFERLLYLPQNIFLDILFNSLYEQNIPHSNIISTEFWPKWPLGNGYKEPDVFIRCEKYHLIIEAKRYDDVDQQYRSQWEEELMAYCNEYGTEKDCYFIALGGFKNADHSIEPLTINNKTVKVFTSKWGRLLF